MVETVLGLLTGVGFVLVGWVVLGGALTGLGLPLAFPRRRRSPAAITLLWAPWVGLALAIGGLQLLHLLVPMGWPVGVGLVLIGWGVLASRAGELTAALRRTWRTHKAALLIVAVVVVWLAHRAIGPPGGDHGLYHLQVVRWNQAYAIVPGLGNLHDRYAFNNASLLLAAAIDHGPAMGRANHVLNSLLIALLVAWGVAGVCRLRRADPARRALAAYDSCALIFALHMANHSMVSSFNTDVAPAGLAFVAGRILLAHLAGARPRCELHREMPLVVLVLAAAVCAKLTAAMFALCGIGIVAWLVLTRLPGSPGRRVVRLAAAFAPAAVLVGPWLGRTVLLSGYLLYPAGVGAFDVDWRIPHSVRQAHMNYIRNYEPWAQHLDQPRAWVDLADRLQRDVLVPAGLALTGLVLLAGLRIARRPRRRALPPSTWLVALAATAGIALWLSISPQRRMGFYLFWILEGVVAAHFAATLARPTGRAFRVLAVVIALAAIANVKKFRQPPGPDLGLHPAPVIAMEPYTTRHGLEVAVPREGFECYDAPLPCMGVANPDLACRRPGDLSAGFRIEPRKRRAR